MHGATQSGNLSCLPRFSSAARKFEQVNTILADFNGEDDVPSSLNLSCTTWSGALCSSECQHYEFVRRMAKRCATLAEVPPPSEWDGTWDSYVPWPRWKQLVSFSGQLAEKSTVIAAGVVSHENPYIHYAHTSYNNSACLTQVDSLHL